MRIEHWTSAAPELHYHPPTICTHAPGHGRPSEGMRPGTGRAFGSLGKGATMDWMLFLTFLAACGAAATTGAMFEPGKWYDALNKPVWTPPGIVFPLVWTALYIAMSLAAMRIAQIEGSGQALAFWAAQIAFNTLWSPIFFGLRRMRAAMIIVSFLWVFVAATMVSFWALDPVAGALFAPYLLWVTIAAALNLSVLRRNPQFA